MGEKNINVDKTGLGVSYEYLSVEEYKKWKKEQQRDKIAAYIIAFIILCVVVVLGYFISYWVPIHVFGAQPVVCFGCK